MTIDQIRLKAVNAGSSALNISGNELISILNSIPASGGGSSQWDDVTGGINYADGNVGINKAAPTVSLDVVGAVDIDATSQNSNWISDFNTVIGDAAGARIIISGTNVDNMVETYGNVKINDLTDYANNAAAISGGLVAGNLYYTNTAGQATLKIVI